MNIKDYLKKKTVTHSLITLSGTFLNGFLGVLYFVYLARNLDPESFGLISFTIIFLAMIADIADFGINTGIINFVSKYINEDKNIAYQYLKLALELKIFSLMPVFLIGYLTAGFIASVIFNKPDLEYSLRFAFFGVGGALLFSFVTNSFQALQKYLQWSALNIFVNGLRLLVTLVLISIGLLNYQNALTIYVSLPFLGFVLGLIFLPNKFLRLKYEGKHLRTFLNYNKWIALSIILSAIYSRIDTFLVAKFLDFKSVGYYSVATQLTAVVPQVVYAIAVVIAPKVASYTSDPEVFNYLKKVQLYSLGIALVGLAAVPLSFVMIPFFYTQAYQQSIVPFIILLLSQLIFLISIPTHQAIFYYFSKPNVMTVISLFQLLIVLSAGYFFIPLYGIMGAATAVLIASGFNFMAANFWILKRFKKI